MDISFFLAQLIGLYSIVVGLSMLMKRKMLIDIFQEIFSTRALSYVMGVLMLVMGLLLVLTHTLWQETLSIGITVIGWFVLVEAIIFLFSSQKILAKALIALNNTKIYFAISTVYLVLGAYLVYSSFGL